MKKMISDLLFGELITLFVLILPVDRSTDFANYYQGLWDCTGDLPDELSFKRGDAIYILSKVSYYL